MEVFERAAASSAQLLQVMRLGGAGDDSTSLPAAVLMTFDVGRILISADPTTRRLEAVELPDADSLPSGLADAAEDEPWWRLLGCSLAAVATESPEKIRLEFRISGGLVRTLILERSGGGLRTSLSE
jgi:hypothetical protein